ncbi:TPA: hypothetical protein DIU27_04265 [Candidatus Collierbacteria bacterium]|uniref:Uncharacterized protein n=1 Tax=Candidatus Collierbacteria bacterium GW2011_GWB2_44_22 TaxID=1618387 RepID=A0A0G1K5W7_9BACT|nr:MAG: hypothetical protein UW44_C0008G0009 [Candidatus Collierbacteria bacterium GW2011_GWB2_44_22]KKT62485.1 MAG: hypothetical protein UW56_C0006G0008 [Candidatus Collierbacteria bacterium GW2011_GWD1_44_27]KKT66906.1 MAG: hypothetical protein UW58_C0001G0010 [Candidatus Collierbacteria bacterium GW2011_GWC2_44_30]KKT88734.1 MAG: hypothetical protein UW88_C0008G0008 [Candidatus Collierbacteria bacterium GW2011_GWD2_45_10]HCQ31567.1 hypothetical protein [Candidatus Collierbacteria bacterium]
MSQKSFVFASGISMPISSAGPAYFNVSGIPINGKPLANTLNLLDAPQDGVSIQLQFGKDGQSRTGLCISRRPQSTQNITIECTRGRHHLNNGLSCSWLVEGEFTISYRTDGGDSSRDVDVVITVRPNHAKESAEISYTATPISSKSYSSKS